jgi:hypothetical protein
MTSESRAGSPEEGPGLLCSECFQDTGLRLDAARFGMRISQPCPRCGSSTGALLDRGRLRWIAHRFFVLGTHTRSHYGGSPRIEFNDQRKNEVEFSAPLQTDVELICKNAEVGLFHYGPALWRLGYIEPLEALQDDAQRAPVVERILREYPEATLTPDQPFFRLRKEVSRPLEPTEFDSPPREFCGSGRLDSAELPVLYGSPDLQLCIHECRVTAEDALHVATLEATKPLRLLNVTALLKEDCTAFESLDMAVHMLFLAGGHSYPISRAISAAAKAANFDGLLFPSYFSLLRTGAPFVETAFGLATRRFPGADAYEASKIVPNVGLFGRPITDGRVRVTCINRVYLRQVAYDLGFGPADV